MQEIEQNSEFRNVPRTNLRLGLFNSHPRRLRRLFTLQKEKVVRGFKKVSQKINIIQIVRWSQQRFCIVNHDTV